MAWALLDVEHPRYVEDEGNFTPHQMLKRTHSRRSGSHIRTKQSKWLDQSLQDMEHNVQHVLKLIQEDGDSFAKRAEMYYKKRPELVNFVEESYRAYRALAERYEHITTELQNANSTLASIFPEQYQVPNDEDDDLPSRSLPQFPIPQFPAVNTSNVPKVSKPLNREWKSLNSVAKQLQAKITANNEADDAKKLSLSKGEALEEIDKLQRDILALQTVKEFVKSSYQSGLSRYWGIENQIIEMQLRVSNLQDEFCLDKVIGNNQARTLMAEAALKSCQEALTQLQEKQEKHDQEARKENNKIDDAREKLNSIRLELLNDQACEEDKVNDKNTDTAEDTKNSNSEVIEAAKDREDNEAASKKNQEITEAAGSQASITLTVLAEKIDNLVNTVLSLETAVSNQTILIEKLRTEADDLHSQIRALEEDKANLINDTDHLRSMIKKLEEQLNNVQKLNQDVESQSHNCQTSLLQACSSLDHLSDKLSNVIPDADDENEEEELPFEVEKEFAEESEKVVLCDAKSTSETTSQIKGIVDRKEQDYNTVKEIQGGTSPIQTNVVRKTNSHPITELENERELNWLQMLLSGVEDREDLLLSEYTTILRKYKEAKNKLSDMEKEKMHNKFEVTLHVRELKSAILKRDEQIQSLRGQTANKDNMEEEKNNSDDPSIVKENEDIKCILQNQPKVISPVEEKFRMEIDAILDENLDYLLRYSISHQQIQKFKCTIKDLHDQTEKLKERKKMQDGSITGDMKTEIKAIHNHLREIKTELTVWLDQSFLLKDELDIKFSSLCNIHEKIMDTLKEVIKEEEGITFTSHQAAKFQGEILNMKQENNKIRQQLDVGIDLVTTLKMEINGIIRKLMETELSGDQTQLRYSSGQGRIPLHSFIFGIKKKKDKTSIFTRMLSKRNKS